jgi:hypothetical protein
MARLLTGPERSSKFNQMNLVRAAILCQENSPTEPSVRTKINIIGRASHCGEAR